mgnify:CR=1 FL=1|tara:strand:- start:1133 stop:3574 length:2442 start_codon:yes stop_codon:yes gene_type:complete
MGENKSQVAPALNFGLDTHVVDQKKEELGITTNGVHNEGKTFPEPGFAGISGDVSPGTFNWGTKGWCRWGWFEDVVLNTFYGFVGEGGGFRTQIRSFSTTTDKDGNQQGRPNKCRHSPDFLYNIDKRVILPGRFFPIPTKTFLKNTLDTPPEMIEQYEQLRGFQTKIDETFKPFEASDTEGYIRNIVFSADFLIKHFGSGISNLESGLNSFWRSVSSIYGGFWDFKIVQSQSNTGRIMVIDNQAAENKVGLKTVFPKSERKSTYEKYKDVGIDKDKVDPQKTFEFSVYGKDSIVSEFTVDVNIDSKMITQAMYHTNKDISTVGHTGMNSPESMGIRALSTLHNVSKTKKQIDDYGKQQEKRDGIVYEISTPYLKGMMSYSKGEDGPLALQDIKTIDLVTKQLSNAIDNANQLIKAKKWKEGMTWIDQAEEKKYLVYDIHGRMHKPIVRGMLFFLNKSSTTMRTVDPIVPLSVSFSLQGIAGITIGDMFAIDYLPEVYRKYAIFQVSSVGQEISTEGWKTTVEAIMRIHMGDPESNDGLLGDPDYSSPVEELSDEEQAALEPLIMDESQQKFHLDSQLAEIWLAKEADTWDKKSWLAKGWDKMWGAYDPADILQVSQEIAAGKLLELKHIEDELVRIHKRMGAIMFDQLAEILRLSGTAMVNDVTDAGVEAAREAGDLSGNQSGPVQAEVRQVKASDLLTTVNTLRKDANVLREGIFNDVAKKGYVFRRPQHVSKISDNAAVPLPTKEEVNKRRNFFTKAISLEGGLKGFKDSGGGESSQALTARDSDKKLSKRYALYDNFILNKRAQKYHGWD